VTGAQDIAKQAGISFASDINDVMSGKMDGATALAKTGGNVPDVAEMDTAAGVETANSSTPPSNPQNPQLMVPPVQSSTNPGQATPI
jgi:hypothetical protein